VETSKPKQEVWRSSAGHFEIVECSPKKILQDVFPEHQGVHQIKGGPGYLYVGSENLPKDRYFSAIVPYDAESRSKLLRDLGSSLALEIRIEKRIFPCRLVKDIAKPYPATWTADADYKGSEGLLSKLPVLCVLHRCAAMAPGGIQYVLDTKDAGLRRYRLATLAEGMEHDQILSALGMPVDKTPREFSCLVIGKAPPGAGQPANAPGSKARSQ
jgi:hypothetical protein